MVLTVKGYKRNSQTGKLEKTGISKVIGNVAQQGGGYKKGTVATQNAQGQTITQLPQNNAVQSLSGPVYGATAQNIPQGTANTSTPQGAVYTPQPSAVPTQSAPLPPAQPLPATDGSLSSSPAPVQGEPTREQLLAQGYGPNDFSLQGETPNFGPGVESGAAAPITPDDLLMFYGLAGIGKTVTLGLANMARQGSLALSREGLEVVAANTATQSASGILGKAGKATVNTASIKNLVKIAAGSGMGRLASLGFILAVAKSSADSRGDKASESVALAASTAELVNKMQRSGDPDLMAQATQLNEEQRAVAKDLDSFLKYMPFKFFQGGLEKGVVALKDEISKGNIAYDNYAQDQAGEALLEQLGNNPDQEEVDAAKAFLSGLNEGPLKTKLRKALNAGQESADTIAASDAARAAENQRIFQERQQEDQQAFQREERLAREAYETQTRNAANAQKQFDEDTATTSSDSSALNFGILGSGGATEFVDRDTASKAYFGKVYQELTPEQQRLLNLLKGKGGN